MNGVQSIQHNDQSVAAIGNVDLLNRPKTGLLCSRKCPADKILEAYDRFKEWAANPETTIISSFHSPVEKECLRLLLKGPANLILCPAREIEHLQIPKDWKPALDADRMLILSPYAEKRADRHTAQKRNKLVAQWADTLYVPFSTPGGALEALAGKVE
jgi:predicted Rossmann fold nucleotide-binding protein DprA/Smf involved in DNA uptake